MGLFDIVQYEVHVFSDGHWHVRVRYPRADRDHAFTEARRLDIEGIPTRVIRDVYEPQSGRNQEITIFVSERAKALGTRAAAREDARDHGGTSSQERRVKKTLARNRDERPAPFAFRATIALGVGLVTALLITAITSWAMTPTQESFASVLARTPAPGAPTTLFVAVMLFSVFTMLRGPLGISRLARVFAGSDDVAPSRAVMRADAAPRPAPQPPSDQDSHVMALSRVMLARFFIEAAPANAARAMEDDIGRRGLALYLAGAVSAMAAHLEIPSPRALLAQIARAALQTATVEALAEARALDPADAQLMAAGRTGMQKYLNTPEERPSMAGALVAWHKAMKATTIESLPVGAAQAS